MAVSNIQEREFVGGSFNNKEFSYEVLYQCDTDNKDGPDVVRRDPFFRIGKAYSFGNDRNPSARLQSVDPSFLSKGNRTKWLVACTYSTEQKEPSDSGGGGGNKPSGVADLPEQPGFEDKLQTLEVRFLTDTEPAYAAKWKDTGTIGASACPYAPEPTFKLGPEGKELEAYIGIPVNSALVPFDPIPTRLVPNSVVRCYIYDNFSYMRDVILGEDAIGKINNAAYTIKGPGNQYELEFEKNTLRLISASVDPHDYTADWCWYSLEFLYKPCGHYLIIPDTGTMVKNDYEPETLGTADGRLPFDTAVDGEHENVKDETGDPVTVPVRLDGRGKPLTGSGRGVTFALRYYEDKNIEFDFEKLPRF
jgi:hypothetical protein